MNRSERDVALNHIRGQLVGELRRELRFRAVPEGVRALARGFARLKLRQIRALDDIRQQAQERAFMSDVWMYQACGLSQRDAITRARAEHGFGGAFAENKPNAPKPHGRK